MNRTLLDLEENSIMAFWLSGSRESECTEIRTCISNEDSVLQSACNVIDHLEPLSDEFQILSGKTLDTIAEAKASVNNTSDIKHYNEQSRKLLTKKNNISALDKQLEARQNTEEFQGRSEQLRQGALLHFRNELVQQRESIALRNKSVEYAAQSLRQYKAELDRILFQRAGIIHSVNNLSSKYYPPVNYANKKIIPLRNVLAELNKPICNTGVFSKVLGSNSFTAISIINKVDPGTGQAIGSLNTMCEILEKSDSELREIYIMSRSFISAAEQYKNTKSRADMLNLLQVIPEVRSCFYSKMGLFDPVFDKLNRAESSVRMIENVVHRLNNPTAENLFYNCARQANTIIKNAKMPFQKIRDILDYSSKLMTDIEDAEKKYQLVIDSLGSENPSFEQVSD
ncbi:hypothetical protein JW835_01635 [bacterium]|nr:hypothetical protein [bacterium]